MYYHDFKQQIISTLSDRLGSDVRITVSDILKNNDTHLDGLTILVPGQNLAPTIYPENKQSLFPNTAVVSELK